MNQSDNIPNWKVLSIQSHVVHGYVGNKCATFPLQLLGFDVDAINSVQLSNHRGYKTSPGKILSEQDVGELFQGLKQNGIVQHYTHLLTGYAFHSKFLREIANILKQLRQANPKLIYVCDPVLGDNGRIYVPKDLIAIYRDEIIPLADIVIPNQYEAELITSHSITTIADVWTAMQWFHTKDIKIVVISSSNLGPPNTLRAFLSINDGSKYFIDVPKLGDGTDFTGTGDLLASLFLAYYTIHNNPVKAFELTISALFNVIQFTLDQCPAPVKAGLLPLTFFEKELKIVQCKKIFENPNVLFNAISADNIN